ncbi:hypothetical protein [Pantoea ananatis]|uniref:hypothetical protein n=1 Tax=Pantoea ananas TaxID=553 RepID=UPI000CEB3C32|nr:hypothetical protein [Pantoea ananatis]AVG77989.1 hypothetical protein B9Q16_18990 [Pantoea ananatis]
MTTNSLNPVDGDIQALIADCQAEIAEIEKRLTTWGEEWIPYLQSKLKRQQVALAALTAEIHSFTFEEDPQPLYTTPPAQLLRPVELPQFKFCSNDCAGSQLWIESQVWNKAIDACAEALRQHGIEVKS